MSQQSPMKTLSKQIYNVHVFKNSIQKGSEFICKINLFTFDPLVMKKDNDHSCSPGYRRAPIGFTYQTDALISQRLLRKSGSLSLKNDKRLVRVKIIASHLKLTMCIPFIFTLRT